MSAPGDVTEELLDSFFEAEVELEKKICRDVVCTSHKDEEGKHTHTHTFTTKVCVADVCFARQASFATCASCSSTCYYLLEISTTRT